MIEANEDDRWIEAFRRGEKEAFDHLVLKYQDRIFNMCCRMMGNREEADDAAQEVFIRAYRGLPSFRGDAAFSTWLYRIAVNTCKNKLTSLAHRMKRVMVRFKSGDEEGGVRDIANGKGTPSTVLEGSEKRKILEKEINALPPDQKAVVVMRDIEGLSYEEIAKVSGDNLGTVKSKLARARQRLRERLERQLR